MRIEIRTILDAGIYRSHGGGQWQVRGTYADGPRGRYAAYLALAETRRLLREAYGNVGCGYTGVFRGGVDVTRELNNAGWLADAEGRRTIPALED